MILGTHIHPLGGVIQMRTLGYASHGQDNLLLVTPERVLMLSGRCILMPISRWRATPPAFIDNARLEYMGHVTMVVLKMFIP